MDASYTWFNGRDMKTSLISRHGRRWIIWRMHRLRSKIFTEHILISQNLKPPMPLISCSDFSLFYFLKVFFLFFGLYFGLKSSKSNFLLSPLSTISLIFLPQIRQINSPSPQPH